LGVVDEENPISSDESGDEPNDGNEVVLPVASKYENELQGKSHSVSACLEENENTSHYETNMIYRVGQEVGQPRRLEQSFSDDRANAKSAG